jgi:hypothetical protein
LRPSCPRSMANDFWPHVLRWMLFNPRNHQERRHHERNSNHQS